MSILDGVLFGLGRDVLLPLALVLGIFGLAVLSAFIGIAWNAVRAWWFKRHGVRCGAMHRHYPTCVLHRGHRGAHAGAWDNGSTRARLRWGTSARGSWAWVEAETPDGAA